MNYYLDVAESPYEFFENAEIGSRYVRNSPYNRFYFTRSNIFHYFLSLVPKGDDIQSHTQTLVTLLHRIL